MSKMCGMPVDRTSRFGREVWEDCGCKAKGKYHSQLFKGKFIYLCGRHKGKHVLATQTEQQLNNKGS